MFYSNIREQFSKFQTIPKSSKFGTTYIKDRTIGTICKILKFKRRF